MPNNIFKVMPIESDSNALLNRLTYRERYLPTIEKMPEHRKCEWLSVRILLKDMLGEEKEILYYPSGKPYLADHSHHISISHTKGYVAVIVNKGKEVAIDIEKISLRVEKVSVRFINPEEEKQLSKQNRLIHLLLHWSAKESVYKMMDEAGIDFKTQMHIRPFEPRINEWGSFAAYETCTSAGQSFTVRYFVDEEYVLTYI
jgi:phosphopantetheinyl transferase